MLDTEVEGPEAIGLPYSIPSQLGQKFGGARLARGAGPARLRPVSSIGGPINFLEGPGVKDADGEGVLRGTFQILSSVLHNISLNFMGRHTAAKSGDAASWGNIARNVVVSGNWANTEGGNSSTVLLSAQNAVNTLINNFGLGQADSGNAFAQNIVVEQAVEHQPQINFSAPVLKPRSHIDIVIGTAYNLVANLTGNASAETGSARAWGNQADTSINNQSQAEAISSTGEGDESSQGETTVLESVNSTDNLVENAGQANASTGGASAIGVLVKNLVHTNLVMNFTFGLLEENSRSNIVVNVIYNLVANLTGNASAETGNARAWGNQADTSINNQSRASAQALANEEDGSGEEANGGEPNQSDGGEDDTRRLEARNSTDIAVMNDGRAEAHSGRASATGVFVENLFRNSLLLNFIFDRFERNSTFDFLTSVVFDVAVDLFGEADSSTGEAEAWGNVATTWIDTNSTARVAGEGSHGNGSNNALSSADNSTAVSVGNQGQAEAQSGEAEAVGVGVQNEVDNGSSLTLHFNSESDQPAEVNFSEQLQGDGQSSANTGAAQATGNRSDTIINNNSAAEAGSGGQEPDSNQDGDEGSSGENQNQDPVAIREDENNDLPAEDGGADPGSEPESG